MQRKVKKIGELEKKVNKRRNANEGKEKGMKE